LTSVEYNSTFGLEPITVPYDSHFNRHEKHPRGWYHGAALVALAKLCAAHDYGLAAVSDAGANPFFTEGGNLAPKTAWKLNTLRGCILMSPIPISRMSSRICRSCRFEQARAAGRHIAHAYR
jgi:hypothetical protein